MEAAWDGGHIGWRPLGGTVGSLFSTDANRHTPVCIEPASFYDDPKAPREGGVVEGWGGY